VSAIGSPAKFTYYEGDVLPFPDQSFDAAISVSVLEHVTGPVNFLSEVLRVMKPGGVFYLAVPNRLNPKETHTGLWGLSYLPRPLGRAYISLLRRGPLEDQNLHFYFYGDIRRMLDAASVGGRHWKVRIERGASTSTLKRGIKAALRAIGIPHQALLPHVMLVCEAS